VSDGGAAPAIPVKLLKALKAPGSGLVDPLLVSAAIGITCGIVRISHATGIDGSDIA
jgi:hypothetical protein